MTNLSSQRSYGTHFESKQMGFGRLSTDRSNKLSDLDAKKDSSDSSFSRDIDVDFAEPKFISYFWQVVTALLFVVLGVGIEYRYQLLHRYAGPIRQNVATTRLSELINSQNSQNQKIDFDIFWEVWDILKSEHIDANELDASAMVDGALKGLVSSTDDPYSFYLPPDDFKQSGENMAGKFYGVGIELGFSQDGILSVIAPLKGSPAQEAGVLAGDLIVNVKDEVKGIDEDSSLWTLDKAVKTIRGEKDSKITLTLIREDEKEPIVLDLRRGEIKVPSLELEFIEHKSKRVAHISLSQFGQNTQNEWEQAVVEILKEKPYIKGIVLDLRGNSGGYFNTAVSIASDFFKKGNVAVQQDKRSRQEYKSSGSARLVGIPVVVLVNKGSASASEILAGALRDQIQAKLVGQNTFGKGTVQDRKELSNGGGVHVTIARWMLPKGQWIHKEGLEVDVKVAYDRDTKEDEQLLKAIEQL